MKAMERNVTRLVAVEHIRAAYGIKTKNWNKSKPVSNKSLAANSAKVFGVPLESLPYYNMEHGSVPRFLVDACMQLMAHVDTEGLFRKSGSIVRLKAHRAKLDAGEECLSTALPCDIAGLVKQFFRDLPEPILSSELNEALLKAQQLATEEERNSATLLLSCVLPERNLSVLRHFFDFLHNVSLRSAENKMDSSNLSVILAPNLLHSGDGSEKMNSNTEKRLRLQATVVRCFIDHSKDFGVLPQFLMERVPTLLGCESSVLSPPQDGSEEQGAILGTARRRRRSLGDVISGALNKFKTSTTPTKTSQSDSFVFSSATPVIATPSSKRKLPVEPGQSFGFSNKKRRSIKKNLGLDSLPNALFSGTSTPGSAYSASGVLDSSQNVLSPVGRSSKQSAARRKSRRASNRHMVARVESLKAGCFSPKAAKKDAPRKSLRLRFSLGKGSKDAGSESIGWRLATQESTTSFFFKDAEVTPAGRCHKKESKSSKFISKSEDNLLTPQCNSSAQKTSWSVETPERSRAFGGRSFTDTPLSLKANCYSEPAILVHKPSMGASVPMKLCCASSVESLDSEGSLTNTQGRAAATPVDTTKVFKKCASDLRYANRHHSPSRRENLTTPSESILMPPPETPTLKVLSVDLDKSSHPTPQRLLADDQNIAFSQIEVAALSPLHIDSTLFESTDVCFNAAVKTPNGSLCAATVSSHNGSPVGDAETEVQHINCSKLIDALDIQSPAHFKLGVSAGLQSTPHRSGLDISEDFNMASKEQESTVLEKPAGQNQQPVLPEPTQSQRARVADHIQHFNKLTLYSPTDSKARKVLSPFKFQRTPVRQSVRRINSLLGDSRRPTHGFALATGQRHPGEKAVSMESVLTSAAQIPPSRGEKPGTPSNYKVGVVKKPPPVPPKKPSTLARKHKALGDVTNKVQPKSVCDSSEPVSKSDQLDGKKCRLQQAVGVKKDVHYYRGSPKKPLNQGRLLSATKPIDL